MGNRCRTNREEASVLCWRFLYKYSIRNFQEGGQMTTEQKNKQVSEWLGIVPYISPGGHERYDFPDFSCGAGIIRLLEEMMKREDWLEFCYTSGCCLVIHNGYLKEKHYKVDIDYITSPGKLLQAVWKWAKERPR